MKLIFEKSVPGRRCVRFSPSDCGHGKEIPHKFLRKTPCALPEISELDLVRHFTNLSKLNFSVDTNFYPLGSCTMKYNPKFTEDLAKLEGFLNLHPLLPQLKLSGILTQGALELLYNLERLLCEISGMDQFTLQPAAGAHGELTGVMLIAAYHHARNEKRRYILVPDSAHGTNPSSAWLAGFEIINIPSNDKGTMDLNILKQELNDSVAAIMMTSPNTLGFFESDIDEISKLAHQKGALMYYDGANLNAILGRCRPADIGFDIIHLNLHKTFATPHGGGGPGAGPVGVKKEIVEFLPIPRVSKRNDGTFCLDHDKKQSIGPITPFHGNFLVLLKAYAYILFLGGHGLKRTSEHAVLNANYILAKLKDTYDPARQRRCLHECVLSASKQAKDGITALDISKFLIDHGIHPPTIYFPLIVKEAMMIEPTETESKETLDRFIDVMIEANRLADKDPDFIKKCPLKTPVSRLDETKAARNMNCSFLE